MARDDDSRWGRQLIASLVALVVVAGVVGGVLAAVALGAVQVAGLGQASGPQARPSLYFPTQEPTVRPSAFPVPTAPSPSASATGASAPSPSPSPSPRHKQKHRQGIALQGFPQQVKPGQRINLTGVYRGAEGTTLQVQRNDGSGWHDFPVTVRVGGGVFHTWVITSHTGENRFRVVDTSSGKKSNAVRITIG